MTAPLQATKPSRHKTPVPVKMWAVIVVGERADWIHWATIERTRRRCWISFLAQWSPHVHDKRRAELKAGRYRIARVLVSVGARP